MNAMPFRSKAYGTPRIVLFNLALSIYLQTRADCILPLFLSFIS